MSKTSKSRRPPQRKATPPDFYLSGAVLVLACFVLFLPLVVDYDFYYPYIFLKSVLFRVAVEVMAMLYVVLAVRCPGYRPRFDWLSGTLLAYFAVMLVSSLPGVSLAAWNSWFGEFARMSGMFSQLHVLAYFFILVQVLRSERQWVVLFTASLFSGMLMALTGVIQDLRLNFIYRFSPEDRLQGAAGNALWFGSLMMINFFLVLWSLFRKDRQETYKLAAKCWIWLLAATDLALVAWAVFGSGPARGLQPSDSAYMRILGIGVALHLMSLWWLAAKRSVVAGSTLFSLMGALYLYGLYLSQSRSSAVGLIAAFALVTALYVVTGTGGKLRWIGSAVLLLVVLAPGFVWMNRQSPWVSRRPALERLTRISVQTFIVDRYWPWKAAALAVRNHPVLGWGLENYSSAFDRHFPPQVINTWESMPWFDRAHNILLDVAVTTGLLGLAVYLSFYGLAIYLLIRQWFRTRDPAGTLPVTALLLAYLISGLATFDIINTDVALYAVLAYVVWRCRQEIREPALETGHGSAVELRFSPVGRLWTAGAAAVLLAAFWFLVKDPYQSNLLLNRGIQSTSVLDPATGAARLVYGKEVRDFFVAANNHETTGRYEVREEFANFAAQLAGTPGVPLEEKRLTAQQAVDFLQESIAQEPENARNYMYFASLVNRCLSVFQAGDPARARSLAERALAASGKAERLSPARPQLYFELGRTCAWLGRYDEQAAAIEKGMTLSPPLSGARYFDVVVKEPNLNLLEAYIGAGKTEAAARQWDRMKSLSISLTHNEYDDLVRFYASKKQFEEIARLRQEQLKASPNDPQLLAELATAYRELGQLELARQTAIKAAALSPQSAASIQAFLDSLKNQR